MTPRELRRARAIGPARRTYLPLEELQRKPTDYDVTTTGRPFCAAVTDGSSVPHAAASRTTATAVIRAVRPQRIRAPS